MGKYLSVDWKKAKQISIGNVAVVTVPVTHISLPTTSSLSSANKKVNDVGTPGNAVLTTFDPYHPPALYFFQDKTGTHPDSVRALLMNFAPDDPKKEDGARKIWTGNLTEWNMQGDSIFVQHLSKSKVNEKYLININANSQSQNASKLSINSGLRTNLFAEIWAAIKWITEAVGYFFGVPGYYDYFVHDHLDWCDFLGGLFSDCPSSGGGGSSGGGAGTSAYTIVYSGFVPGYDDGFPGSGDWSTYYADGGGWNNSPNNPCNTAIAGGQTIQQVDPGSGCGGTQIVVTVAMTINATAVKYNLTSDQQYWLNNNTDAYFSLNNYINSTDGLYNYYFGAVDFLDYSIGYLQENPNATVADIIAQALTAVSAKDQNNELSDPDNIIYTDTDPTAPVEYQQGNPWPTIKSVFLYSQFVPHRKDAFGHDINCFVLAKEQMAKLGYTFSGYDVTGAQTFQTYSTSGVNVSITKKAITYLISALSNHIPVGVAVEAIPNFSSGNLDGISDHFMVIDGMGTDANGQKYFHFLDNATGYTWLGNSPNNKLYYNETTNIISGSTAAEYPRNQTGSNNYILTQVRKSIKQ